MSAGVADPGEELTVTSRCRNPQSASVTAGEAGRRNIVTVIRAPFRRP
jgi:hypothetical protein